MPAPIGDVPILIGGRGIRRTLPIVAAHADIWHTFATADQYRRKNVILKKLIATAGREDTAIERSVQWPGREAADEFLTEGVTLFTTETPQARTRSSRAVRAHSYRVVSASVGSRC